MTSKEIANGIIRAVAVLTGIFLLLLFLYKIQSVLAYIAIAMVVALIARPIIRFLKQKLKFKNSVAVIATMLFFVSIIFGFIRLMIPLIEKQSENLSLLNSNQFQEQIQLIFTHLNDYFKAKNINVFESLQSLNISSLINKLPDVINSFVGAFGSIIVGMMSVLFISFFFMKDSELFSRALTTISPKGSESRVKKSFDTIKDLLSRYFVGLVFQITILFIIYTIVLSIFDVENAVVIALLCATLNLIPYVGPLIGAFLIVFLTMTSNLHLDFQTVILPKTIYVLLGYTFAQLIDNFISQPLIFSRSVKSHPLEIFLAILIFGTLFGIIGMVVAVPTYTAIKVILKEFLADNKIVKSLTKQL
jgi:predicted PurR-regulated permease PerM